MRKIAIFLALILLTPAMTRACECCPSIPQDGTLVIQKAPCHGCCPGSAFQQDDAQGVFGEKSAFVVPHSGSGNSLDLFQDSAQWRTPKEKKEPLFFAFSPPPPSSFHTLPIVLRI